MILMVSIVHGRSGRVRMAMEESGLLKNSIARTLPMAMDTAVTPYVNEIQ